MAAKAVAFPAFPVDLEPVKTAETVAAALEEPVAMEIGHYRK
ncbi:MAG: hypothetical protein ACLS7Q_04225 [Varibaculum cambriense]